MPKIATVKKVKIIPSPATDNQRGGMPLLCLDGVVVPSQFGWALTWGVSQGPVILGWVQRWVLDENGKKQLDPEKIYQGLETNEPFYGVADWGE
jgi:hypothetical protein